MAEYDVRLEFTFDAEDRATADETVGGIMGHIVDRTDCGSVGGRMVEGEEDTTEHRVTADPHREELEAATMALYHACNCLVGQADADSTVATVLTPVLVAFEKARLTPTEETGGSDV